MVLTLLQPVQPTIVTTLRDQGYTGLIPIVAIAANEQRVNATTVRELRDNGVRLRYLHTTTRQAADEEIIRMIRNWTMTGNILGQKLCTSDKSIHPDRLQLPLILHTSIQLNESSS